MVIVGGGDAGNMAAETLRREGYSGRITMLSADAAGPCDRPNLSKGFLAGTAAAESNPLRVGDLPRARHRAETELSCCLARHAGPSGAARRQQPFLLRPVVARHQRRASASRHPGGVLEHVHYLRTLADSRAIVEKALISQRAVVIGASFIGLEAASSLRARNVDVQAR